MVGRGVEGAGVAVGDVVTAVLGLEEVGLAIRGGGLKSSPDVLF